MKDQFSLSETIESRDILVPVRYNKSKDKKSFFRTKQNLSTHGFWKNNHIKKSDNNRDMNSNILNDNQSSFQAKTYRDHNQTFDKEKINVLDLERWTHRTSRQNLNSSIDMRLKRNPKKTIESKSLEKNAQGRQPDLNQNIFNSISNFNKTIKSDKIVFEKKDLDKIIENSNIKKKDEETLQKDEKDKNHITSKFSNMLKSNCKRTLYSMIGNEDPSQSELNNKVLQSLVLNKVKKMANSKDSEKKLQNANQKDITLESISKFKNLQTLFNSRLKYLNNMKLKEKNYSIDGQNSCDFIDKVLMEDKGTNYMVFDKALENDKLNSDSMCYHNTTMNLRSKCKIKGICNKEVKIEEACLRKLFVSIKEQVREQKKKQEKLLIETTKKRDNVTQSKNKLLKAVNVNQAQSINNVFSQENSSRNLLNNAKKNSTQKKPNQGLLGQSIFTKLVKDSKYESDDLKIARENLYNCQNHFHTVNEQLMKIDHKIKELQFEKEEVKYQLKEIYIKLQKDFESCYTLDITPITITMFMLYMKEQVCYEMMPYYIDTNLYHYIYKMAQLERELIKREKDFDYSKEQTMNITPQITQASNFPQVNIREQDESPNKIKTKNRAKKPQLVSLLKSNTFMNNQKHQSIISNNPKNAFNSTTIVHANNHIDKSSSIEPKNNHSKSRISNSKLNSNNTSRDRIFTRTVSREKFQNFVIKQNACSNITTKNDDYIEIVDNNEYSQILDFDNMTNLDIVKEMIFMKEQEYKRVYKKFQVNMKKQGNQTKAKEIFFAILGKKEAQLALSSLEHKINKSQTLSEKFHGIKLFNSDN